MFGLDLSDLRAFAVAMGTNISTYVAGVLLLVWITINRLFRSSDQAWLRVFSVVFLLLVASLGFYAVRSSVTEVQAEETLRQVDTPVRLVVRGVPTSDLRVRQALLFAVMWDMLPMVVAEVTFDESRSNSTAPWPDYDPERGCQLMAEAGYPSGLPIDVRLASVATAAVTQGVEVLAADWSYLNAICKGVSRGTGGGTAASAITVDVYSQR